MPPSWRARCGLGNDGGGSMRESGDNFPDHGARRKFQTEEARLNTVEWGGYGVVVVYAALLLYLLIVYSKKTGAVYGRGRTNNAGFFGYILFTLLFVIGMPLLSALYQTLMLSLRG